MIKKILLTLISLFLTYKLLLANSYYDEIKEIFGDDVISLSCFPNYMPIELKNGDLKYSSDFYYKTIFHFGLFKEILGEEAADKYFEYELQNSYGLFYRFKETSFPRKAILNKFSYEIETTHEYDNGTFSILYDCEIINKVL